MKRKNAPRKRAAKTSAPTHDQPTVKATTNPKPSAPAMPIWTDEHATAPNRRSVLILSENTAAAFRKVNDIVTAWMHEGTIAHDAGVFVIHTSTGCNVMIRSQCDQCPNMTFIPPKHYAQAVGECWAYPSDFLNVVFGFDTITPYERAIIADQLARAARPPVIAVTAGAMESWRSEFAYIIDLRPQGHQGKPTDAPAAAFAGETTRTLDRPMPKGGRKKEPPTDGLVSSKRFAELLGKSKSWLRDKKRHDPKFPEPYQPGGNGGTDMYLPSAVTAYVDHITTTATNRDKPR